MKSKNYGILILVLVTTGCLLPMDRVTLFKISETEEYMKYTKCGHLKIQAASTLSKNRFNLRMQLKQAIDTFYPQKLKIIDGDGNQITYEIWWSDDQITKKEIRVKNNYTVYYSFETQHMEGVRFWADSLGKQK